MRHTARARSVIVVIDGVDQERLEIERISPSGHILLGGKTEDGRIYQTELYEVWLRRYHDAPK